MNRWHWLALGVASLDQGTKYLAQQFLELHTPVTVLPFFQLTLTFNPGAAFSFLSEASGWQRWFFSVISLVVSFFLVVWLQRIPRDQRWLPWALALILGGAMGNLWDRLTLGRVVDFLVLYYHDWYWPAFNLADSAISLGAAMLVISFLGGEDRADEEPPLTKNPEANNR
jgi:signal peptidase II